MDCVTCSLSVIQLAQGDDQCITSGDIDCINPYQGKFAITSFNLRYIYFRALRSTTKFILKVEYISAPIARKPKAGVEKIELPIRNSDSEYRIYLTFKINLNRPLSSKWNLIVQLLSDLAIFTLVVMLVTVPKNGVGG